MTTFPLTFKHSLIWKSQGKNKNLDKAIESLLNINFTEKERDDILKAQKKESESEQTNENIRYQRKENNN